MLVGSKALFFEFFWVVWFQLCCV